MEQTSYEHKHLILKDIVLHQAFFIYVSSLNSFHLLDVFRYFPPCVVVTENVLRRRQVSV
jgi:hypothetical protein